MGLPSLKRVMDYFSRENTDLKKLMGRKGYTKFMDAFIRESAQREAETNTEVGSRLEAIITKLNDGGIKDEDVHVEVIGTSGRTYREGKGFVARVDVNVGEGVVLSSRVKYSDRKVFWGLSCLRLFFRKC